MNLRVGLVEWSGAEWREESAQSIGFFVVSLRGKGKVHTLMDCRRRQSK